MKLVALIVSACAVLLSVGCAKQDARRALCDILAEITGVPISSTEREQIERELKDALLGRELATTYSTLKERVGRSHSVVWEAQTLMDGRVAFPLYVRTRTRGGDPEFLVIFYADGTGKLTDIGVSNSIQFREGY